MSPNIGSYNLLLKAFALCEISLRAMIILPRMTLHSLPA